MFLNQEPALAEYRFALSGIRRAALHLLPEAEQTLLDQFQPQIGDWQDDLYEQIVAGIPFGTVQTSSGPLDVVRQRNLIATNADPRVREEGFKRRYAGFASQRDLLAFALIHTVEAQTALAKAHHYADAPAHKYESLYFNPQQTRSLLAFDAQHGEVAKRYEKIRSHDFERAYHQPAQAWDLSAPAPGFSPPITSLADARSASSTKHLPGWARSIKPHSMPCSIPPTGVPTLCREGRPTATPAAFPWDDPAAPACCSTAAMTEPSKTSLLLRTKADMRSIAS